MAQQQLVEIAKALSVDARVLILDEPTAALRPHEVDRLFAIVRGLTRRGVAIIYVTHRLDEVFALCDRVTVLARRPAMSRRQPRITTRPTSSARWSAAIVRLFPKVERTRSATCCSR